MFFNMFFFHFGEVMSANILKQLSLKMGLTSIQMHENDIVYAQKQLFLFIRLYCFLFDARYSKIEMIIFKQSFLNQDSAGRMKKQRRSKILATTNEKQNQGQRKSNLKKPPQRKHIFKKKKKYLQNQRFISNIQFQTFSTLSSDHDEKNSLKYNLSSHLHIAKNPLLNSQKHTSVQQTESFTKDYLISQFNFQIFKKNQNSEQLGLVQNYLSSIGQHLYEQQSKFPMPNLCYLRDKNFSQKQRIESIQIIYTFSIRYKFKIDTIFMALSIFHRIAFDKEFNNYNNALKAIVSIFIAAKYEQIAIPKLQCFTNFQWNERNLAENILKLEAHILIYFKFCLSFPSPLQFIELLAIRYDIDQNLKNRIIQLCYCSLKNLSLWQGRGSLLALACFCFIKPQIEVNLQRNEDLMSELGWRMQQLAKLSMMQ